MSTPATGRASPAILCVLVPLLVMLSACTMGDQRGAAVEAGPEPEPEPTAQVQVTAPPVSTKTSIARVYGRLPHERRKAVRLQVGRVVDRWWEASYLGGHYPRSGFRAAFPGFTKGAEARARRDKPLMTNSDVSEGIEIVTPAHREVLLDVLAVDRSARSVTARFVLRFRTTGEREGSTVVRGRLFLTRRGGPWRVFGYDVTKRTRP